MENVWEKKFRLELEDNFLWKSEHPKLCHAAYFMILYIEEF